MNDKEKLQIIYERITQDRSPKSLFLGIADYVRFVDESAMLSAIVKEKVLNERDKRLEELNELGEALLKESKETFAKLKQLVKDNGIKNADVSKELDDYRRVLIKEIQYSSTFPEAVSHSVDMIITAIKEAGYTDLVSDYIMLDRHGNITSWTFAHSYRPYMNLLKQSREQHKITIWGHWDELYRVYEVIEKKDEITAELEKNNDNMGLMNFYGLIHEMQQVFDEKRDFEAIYFKEEDFRSYINRFHSFIRIQVPEPRIRVIDGRSPVPADSKVATNEFTDSRAQILQAISDLHSRFEELVKLLPENERKVVVKVKHLPLPLTLPADIKWEEITIQFHDGHNVTIKYRDKKYRANYKEMGFQDDRKLTPNQQWIFLKGLAANNGEVAWGDKLANDRIKQLKKRLSEQLRSYFSIEDDPFLPYRREKMYKVKFHLLPEHVSPPNSDKEGNLGINEFYNENMTSVYEESF